MSEEPTKKIYEIENLNSEAIDIEGLGLEDLEGVSGGTGETCGIFPGPCTNFSGSCGTFGPQTPTGKEE